MGRFSDLDITLRDLPPMPDRRRKDLRCDSAEGALEARLDEAGPRRDRLPTFRAATNPYQFWLRNVVSRREVPADATDAEAEGRSQP